IIYEKLPNDVNWGGDSSGNNGGFKWLDTSNINAPTYMGPAPSDADIYDLLRSLGYTDISKNGSQWSYTAPNGLSYSGVTITPQGKVEVKINGQTLTVNEGTFTPSANLGTGVSYSAATHGTYAKATYADGTTDHVDMTAADNLTQNVSYEIGYYKINVASSVTANSLSNGGGTITAAVDNADNAVFAKKGEAGDTVDMPVELTYGAAVTGGGLKFTANNSATVRGSIPAGAAGTKVVTVEVPTNTLAGNVTVALTAADQAVTINIYVNGTPTTVEVGAKISDIVNDIPDNANAFVLVQELAYGDTAASVDADVATTVKAGNYAIQSSDTNLNIGTVEFTKYTPNTVNVNGTALTASTAVTDGEVYTTGGQDYITVGASVKTTLTATADIVAPDTWATYTTKMVVASATATDTVAYTGSVAGWAASATQTLTNNTPFTTGTASTIVAEDDTFVITHDGVAASVTTFAPGNVTVTAPAEN
ncbi:MAG: hypothetical protein HFG09_10220, partial [Oscillibacter sp.]|nr:hypothetical protein [Oscillibacter sp.]